jgi:hypothetical protein
MWESVGIDYILLLDLDASKSNIKPSFDQIFNEAATYSILFFINLIIFHTIKVLNENIPEDDYTLSADYAYILPIILLLGVLITLIKNLGHISYGVFSIDVFLNVSIIIYSIHCHYYYCKKYYKI